MHRIGVTHGVEIALIAHAGDGNTHPLLIVDPTDPASVAAGEAAFGAIMDLAIALGGTITGEHGVGTLKRPWLVNQLGEDVDRTDPPGQGRLRPPGILNPGVILDGLEPSTWAFFFFFFPPPPPPPPPQKKKKKKKK